MSSKRLRGYSRLTFSVCLQLGLNSKGEDRLRPVKRIHDAWNDLEIPLGHKDIVQSLVESHFSKTRSEKMDFDLVRDKGKEAQKPLRVRTS